MSSEIKIEIDLSNAAFDDEPMTETARILRELANKLESRGLANDFWRLHDASGNRVGVVRHVTE